MSADSSSKETSTTTTTTTTIATSYQDTFQESVIRCNKCLVCFLVLQTNTFRNVIAGGVARICSATALHPLDVAKTRMQFQRRGHTQGVFYKHGNKIKSINQKRE